MKISITWIHKVTPLRVTYIVVCVLQRDRSSVLGKIENLFSLIQLWVTMQQENGPDLKIEFFVVDDDQLNFLVDGGTQTIFGRHLENFLGPVKCISAQKPTLAFPVRVSFPALTKGKMNLRSLCQRANARVKQCCKSFKNGT